MGFLILNQLLLYDKSVYFLIVGKQTCTRTLLKFQNIINKIGDLLIVSVIFKKFDLTRLHLDV